MAMDILRTESLAKVRDGVLKEKIDAELGSNLRRLRGPAFDEEASHAHHLHRCHA